MMMRGRAEPKYQVIRDALAHENNMLSITLMCELADVSRSGYYKWLDEAPEREAREAQDHMDFELILEAARFRGYDKGARGIHMRLLHMDPLRIMNVKKIWRLMRKYNYVCPIRRANPYRRKLLEAIARTGAVANNEVGRHFIQAPRKILLTDITYLRRRDGKFSYMCSVLDAYTRQLLGYAVMQTMQDDVVMAALNMMLASYGNELVKAPVVHSDQGSQFKSTSVIALLKDSELRRSMSKKATPWDNAPQESFFGHMKDDIGEKLDLCHAHEDICRVIDDWTDYYNNDRYQWGLAKLSPNEYYQYLTTGRYPLPVPPPKDSDDLDDADPLDNGVFRSLR